MSNNLFNFIKNISDSFRITYWDGQISLANLNDVYNLCVASLIRDYQFNEIIELMDGNFVEISLKVEEETKTGRYIYRGIIAENRTRPQIKLEVPPRNDENPNTWYFVDAANNLWRLKKIKKIGRINNDRRLQIHEISQLNLRKKNLLELTNKAFLQLEQDTSIELKKMFSFKRTKILFLLKGNIKDFQNDVGNGYQWLSFTELFPVGMYKNGLIKDWNNEGHLMTQRGFDNYILFFSFVEDVLEFVEKYKEDKFLIITNKFNQIYDDELYQSLVNCFEAEPNKARISLLVLPQTKHLSNIYSSSMIPINNPLISPIIFPFKVFKESEINKQIQLINNNDIETYFKEIDQKIREYNQNYAPYAEILKKIKWLSFSILEEPSLVHSVINELKKEFNYDQQNLASIQALENSLLDFHPSKLDMIKEMIKTNPSILIYVNSMTSPDLENNTLFNNRIINNSQFQSESFIDKVLLIYFIDYWFIRDIILPQLMFGHIKIDQIKFVLYRNENEILSKILRGFKKKFKPLIENSKLISESFRYPEDDTILEIEDIDYLPNYDTDLNPHVNKHYIKNNQGRENDPPVDIQTYFFVDTLGNKFFTYLTINFKPIILKNDQLQKKDIDEIQLGSSFLFFGDEGARDILHNYPVLYYNNSNEEMHHNIRVELKDKWRTSLKTYYDNHNFDKLKEKLIQQNLDMNDNKLKRWLNDEDIIGPQNPEEEIKKIAHGLNDEYLKIHYNEVAEACRYFQSKAKSIGKKIRKIALNEFTEITQEDFYQGLSDDGKQKIVEIANSIKLVRLTQRDTTKKKVLRSESNKLFKLN